MFKKSFFLSLFLSQLIFISSSYAVNVPGCACWRWGYKAAAVKHTKDTVQKTRYFQMCSGKIESDKLVGSESNYWEGWDAGIKKEKMLCPYTDNSKNPT